MIVPELISTYSRSRRIECHGEASRRRERKRRGEGREGGGGDGGGHRQEPPSPVSGGRTPSTRGS